MLGSLMCDHVSSIDPMSLSQSLCSNAAMERQAANELDSNNTDSPLELLARLEFICSSTPTPVVSRSDSSIGELGGLRSDKSSSDRVELDSDSSTGDSST